MFSSISNSLLIDQLGNAQTTPFAIKDLDHRFVHLNDAFAKAIGFPASEIIGKNELELGRSEALVLGDAALNWPGLWELENQAIASEAGTCGIECPVDSDPGAHAVRTPLKNENGDVIALLVQLQDVTEVRDTEVRDLELRTTENAGSPSARDGETTTMDSVLASLMACHDIQTLATRLADVLLECTGVDGTYISVMNETGDYLEFVAACGTHSSRLIGTRRARNDGIVGRAWGENRTISVDDANSEGSIHGWDPNTQICAVPLVVDGDTVATLSAVSVSTDSRLTLQIPLLERIAGVATIAIVNTRLIEESDRALKRSRAVADISEMLVAMDDTTIACDRVCRLMLSAVDVERASSFLVDQHGVLQTHVSWGTENGQATRIATMSTELLRESIPSWCVEHNRSANIKRLVDDPRESIAVHEVHREHGVGATACIPLVKQDVVIGAMLISRKVSQRDFNEADIDGFHAVVNQLSTAIERLTLSNELQHQAFHDRLTMLPNRHNFELELERSIEEASQYDTNVSVLFIDLDGFKDVNDTLGHAAGDQLLMLVAGRMSGVLKSCDVLARMGGDEFAAILRNDPDDESGSAVAYRLLECLSPTFDIDGERVNVGASIGISSFPDNGATVDDLLRCADVAMYQAKRGGKGCICCFDEMLAEKTRERTLLEQELRVAVDNGDFRLFYQPQVRCNDSQVVGVEALIRWESPTRGLVAPNDFIPIAEETGLINRIGSWVINEAVRQLADWQATEMQGMRVCINIAAPQFQVSCFADEVLDALERHGAPANLLELEVTESVVMDNVGMVVQRLHQLRESGVRIAIDDFGTGYSSLSYLQELPLDVLKIDRTFVSRLVDESDEQSLVNTILLLASGLGLETVAEGVELPEQRDAIKRLGCDLIQGYLYSRPVPAEDIPKAIAVIQGRLTSDVELRRAA